MAQCASESKTLLSLSGIGVNFGATRALDRVSLDVEEGEIVGLLGHNGAGKSTLLNVATGAVRAGQGRMQVNGVDVSTKGDPRALAAAGVKVIHQEPALVANLRVWENICLATGNDRLGPAEQMAVAGEALPQVGATAIDVRGAVEDLSFGERQLVDIARAVATDLKVILLDEPTAALGREETLHLHALLEELAAAGRGVVYVSHRLKDVLDLCTRLVVMREGIVVLDEPNDDVSLADLTHALSGSDGRQPASGRASRRRESRTDEAHPDHGLTVVAGEQPLSFPPGQVIGLFGMAADAQFALLESLCGLGQPVEARLGGRPYSPSSPLDAKRHGVHFLSSDRERDSLVHDMTGIDNMLLPWLSKLSRWDGVSRKSAANAYATAARQLNIQGAAPSAPIAAFSGGNRQKIAVARWMLVERPDVLLLAQPTQGVDVGARRDVAQALEDIVESGVSVVVASAEADEIALLCDAAYVCRSSDWLLVERGSADFEQALLSALLDGR